VVVEVPNSPEIVVVSFEEKEKDPEEVVDPEEEGDPEEDEGEVGMADVDNVSGEEGDDSSNPDYDPSLDR